MKTIQSVEKAIHILDYIAENHGKKNLTDISRALEMSIGTLHGFVATLEQCDMIKKDSETGKYLLGERIFKYSLISDKGTYLARICKPYLDNIRNATNETTHLALPIDRQKILYAEKSESTLPFRLTSLVGTIDDAKDSAVGYILYSLPIPKDSTEIQLKTFKERTYCLKYEPPLDAYCVGTCFQYSLNGDCAGISLVIPKVRFDSNTENFYIEPFMSEICALEKQLLSF